jgi:hypothetical protein
MALTANTYLWKFMTRIDEIWIESFVSAIAADLAAARDRGFKAEVTIGPEAYREMTQWIAHGVPANSGGRFPRILYSLRLRAATAVDTWMVSLHFTTIPHLTLAQVPVRHDDEIAPEECESLTGGLLSKGLADVVFCSGSKTFRGTAWAVYLLLKIKTLPPVRKQAIESRFGGDNTGFENLVLALSQHLSKAAAKDALVEVPVRAFSGFVKQMDDQLKAALGKSEADDLFKSFGLSGGKWFQAAGFLGRLGSLVRP